MKTTFKVNALVSALLVSRRFNVDGQNGITQACESFLGSMTTTKEEGTRSGLKERKNGQAVTAENIRIEYAGAKNDVSAFIAWNDRIASLEKRAAKDHAVVTVTDIPAGLLPWIEKFPMRDNGATPKAERKSRKAAKPSAETASTPDAPTETVNS